TSEMISRRRAFALLGLAALSLAVPPTILTVSDAEAQTVGMQRRAARRAGRHMRREERRTGRPCDVSIGVPVTTSPGAAAAFARAGADQFALELGKPAEH